MLSARARALSPSVIREMNGRRRPTSIDLTLGQPALPPDPEVLERATRAMAHAGYGYTENAGLLALRELIAAHHRLPGRERPENVIVTVGSEEAVFLALMASVDEGAEVLIPEPGYPAYPGIVRTIGAVPVTYPIQLATGLVARAEELAARITPRTRALVLNTPSNPFGSVDERAELEAIAALAARHALVVLTDEIYRDLVYGDEVTSIAQLAERVIFVGGLSKSCAFTGLRLGYLIADAPFVKQATLLHQLLVTCAPRLAQHAAIEVFREPERLRAHLPYYVEARAALERAAPSLPEGVTLRLGDGAFYAILDVSRYTSGDPMTLALALLEEEDVVVVPGTAFGPSGHWFWRLSYAVGAEQAAEGLTRIGRFLGRRSPAV